MDPQIKAKMHARISTVMKERTGPSFADRVAVSAAKFSKETKVVEESQAKKIQASVARARARPCESAPRTKDMTPPSVEECGKQHARTRRENEARFAQDHAESRARMDAREPLFKLSDVSNAFEMQKQRQAEHRKNLRDEEARRWEHLQELQERVINRPLLLEDPAASPPADGEPETKEDKEEKEKDPNWKAKLQVKMNRKIKETIKERSGLSFEERVAARAAKLRKETKVQEDAQAKLIEDAVVRAKARPSESPFRPKELSPPSVEDWGKVHAQTRRDNEANYAEVDAERKKALNAREPLFKVSEVEAVFEEQRKRKEEHKRDLRNKEKECWALLQSMQERVVDRPLLVENFQRPVHSKGQPELRLIPNHTKPLQMDKNIKKCCSQPAFLDSAWGKEMESLKERMDKRIPLSECAYPPKKYETKPPPPKFRTDLDKRMEEQTNQPWFKQTQWASEVAAIRERQNNRVPLSECSYPPKKYDD